MPGGRAGVLYSRLPASRRPASVKADRKDFELRSSTAASTCSTVSPRRISTLTHACSPSSRPTTWCALATSRWLLVRAGPTAVLARTLAPPSPSAGRPPRHWRSRLPVGALACPVRSRPRLPGRAVFAPPVDARTDRAHGFAGLPRRPYHRPTAGLPERAPPPQD